jgi:hypothetical protein
MFGSAQQRNAAARHDAFFHGRTGRMHQIFIRQQNLELYRSLVAASEVAAAKADARQEKLLKLLAEEVANEPPPR